VKFEQIDDASTFEEVLSFAIPMIEIAAVKCVLIKLADTVTCIGKSRAFLNRSIPLQEAFDT
jgi:hypothetical protein